MDLTDKRLHSKRVHWRGLIEDGFDPHEVLKEAQRQGMWKLALSAQHRIENTKPRESNNATNDD